MKTHLTTDSSLRLDVALLRELKKSYPALSRTGLKEYFKLARVRMNGSPVEPSLALEPGTHTIEILDFSAKDFELPVAQASKNGCFLPVVHEDENLLILDKKSGVPSVPHSSEETETAVGAALAHLPAIKAVGRRGLEPAILHRLDTGTSGLLVFAKNQNEYERLHRIWAERGLKKIYRALCRSASEQPLTPQTIDTPLGHDSKSSKKMIALTRQFSFRGKALPAITHILESKQIRPDFFDYKVQIDTGVMHQIRCHLASKGWPILGDLIYRGVPSSRLWLHAWRLELPRADGTTLKLEAPLPPGWASAQSD